MVRKCSKNKSNKFIAYTFPISNLKKGNISKNIHEYNLDLMISNENDIRNKYISKDIP